MASDLLTSVLVVWIIRRQFYCATIRQKAEVVSGFFVGNPHCVISARINAGRMRVICRRMLIVTGGLRRALPAGGHRYCQRQEET